MKNVLVLGATGNVAQYFIDSFANVAPDDMQLTLWARNSRRLPRSQHEAYQVYEGDMYDATTLVPAIADADIIVSFIGSSPMPTYAQALIDAINMSGRTIDRVIWLGAGGMMGETIGGEGRIARSMPGYFNQQLRGGEMLMEADFDTTIVSPVMFHGGPAGKPIIFDSHETTPAQTVSRETIALVYLEALLQDKWRNQMITVGDRK